ncbi:thiamine pyrophosphate-dependent enzyme [Amorphus orientalis]|uniref:Acetolactate synthase-1/2/3 large subunit n=1 Tax=Amorphus orientalis TaxID=649198 RepID=A0AAE4AT98_9HYPH|nr:thiamine pyrophosphate-dependent enzyme [Amorphus orientalis]MDQ0314789.1 acetolactate synthase-1/2/3 large subunit [Amorphus orientalis]
MDVMTGGEALVRTLEAHDVDTVFGLPGAQIYGLFDALARSNRIRVVGARHEQGCGYMAFGYARASGRPGVYSVVPGPGVLNTGAALITALGGNEPVLCLTGQVPSAFLGRGRGHLHEMPDQLATLEGLTKWADRVDHPSQVPDKLGRAFQEMASLRRGPAAVEMPWDQFTNRAPVALTDPLPLQAEPPVDPDRVADAARRIADAKAPMIFVGSGAIEATEEVRALAERIGAPVVAFRSGRGIVSNRDPLGLTIAEAYELWAETDLVIGIGTRLEVPGWRWSWRPEGQTTIRIDIDPAELRRAPSDVDILGGAASATAELLAALERIGAALPDRSETIAVAKAKAAREIQEIRPHAQYLKVLRDVLPDDGIVTDELCQAGFASWYAFPVYQPRTFLSSGYQGTLGSGYATALGAKVAKPDAPVVSICGDGGFMFAVQELATAVQYGIAVTVLVFNNSAYGNVRRDQEQHFDGRVLASPLQNPDFPKLAESFGARAARVTSPEELKPALERALASGLPTVIEIPLDLASEVSPWRFIHR